MTTFHPDDNISSQMITLAHVIICDEMFLSGANVIIWDEMLSSGANVIIWDEMLSSWMKCYHLGCNVII